jgi:hypothetical protein
LLARLRATLKEADDVLGSVDLESFLTRRKIQHDGGTVLKAIYHVVEHFWMRTGQTIMLEQGAGREGFQAVATVSNG